MKPQGIDYKNDKLKQLFQVPDIIRETKNGYSNGQDMLIDM